VFNLLYYYSNRSLILVDHKGSSGQLSGVSCIYEMD